MLLSQCDEMAKAAAILRLSEALQPLMVGQ
jgi:hypothetical protein